MICHFPKNFESGVNLLLNASRHPDINLDLGVVVLNKGETYTTPNEKEAIATLTSGEVQVQLGELDETLSRSDVFYGEPALAHAPAGCSITLTGLAESSEIIIVATNNANDFPPEIMRAADCLNPSEIRAVGLMNDSAVREARTYMDRSNRPHSNLFIGEVVMAPGKWSSFPPHFHKEPEIYFYKFLPDNGYGYAEVDHDVHIVRQHSLTAMTKGEGHPQVTTPAYAEWYLWCIRLDDNKQLVSTFVPEHEWANHPENKLYPELKP